MTTVPFWVLSAEIIWPPPVAMPIWPIALAQMHRSPACAAAGSEPIVSQPVHVHQAKLEGPWLVPV